jgi:hypothetical protein
LTYVVLESKFGHASPAVFIQDCDWHGEFRFLGRPDKLAILVRAKKTINPIQAAWRCSVRDLKIGEAVTVSVPRFCSLVRRTSTVREEAG